MSENSADQIRIPLKVLASTLIILGILVIGAGIATYVIPAGQYTDEVRDGLTVKVYQLVDPAPVPMVSAPTGSPGRLRNPTMS